MGPESLYTNFAEQREVIHALTSQKMTQPKPVACCTSKMHHELTCTTGYQLV